MLSFSIEKFYLVLESYNLAIWPIQVFAYILAGLSLFFIFKPTKYSSKIVLSILSFFWLFNGIVFGFIYWAPSHTFGYIFGISCVLQGLMFIHGIWKFDITTGYPNITDTLIGILFVLYAAVGYQILGYYLGHIYPVFFPVGLVPCPTTIFTFGLFLIISKKISVKYYIIPLIISLGGFMVVPKGIYEDIGLIIVGILGTILIIRRNAQFKIKDIKTIWQSKSSWYCQYRLVGSNGYGLVLRL